MSDYNTENITSTFTSTIMAHMVNQNSNIIIYPYFNHTTVKESSSLEKKKGKCSSFHLHIHMLLPASCSHQQNIVQYSSLKANITNFLVIS